MPIRKSSATAGYSTHTAGSSCDHAVPGVQLTATRLTSGAAGKARQEADQAFSDGSAASVPRLG